jgi:hypothetical protein
MFRTILKTAVLAGFFSFAISGASPQEIIHAYAGTVSAVDAVSRTITVAAADSSKEIFNDTADPKSFALLNKKMRDGVVAVNTVREKGTYVIVYYFSNSNGHIAVGLRNLGPGPFIDQIGTVFKHGEHFIAIRRKSGEVQTFNVNSDTVAETSIGAIGGLKFQPEKGNQVRVTATAANGSADAQFIDGTIPD